MKYNMLLSPLFHYFLSICPLCLQYTKYMFFAQVYVTYSGSGFNSVVQLIQQLLKNMHIFIIFLNRAAVTGFPGRYRLCMR